MRIPHGQTRSQFALRFDFHVVVRQRKKFGINQTHDRERIGQLGGFTGNYLIGFLNDRTHSLTASFGFIALVYFASGSLILSLRIRNPLNASQSSNLLENVPRSRQVSRFPGSVWWAGDG